MADSQTTGVAGTAGLTARRALGAALLPVLALAILALGGFDFASWLAVAMAALFALAGILVALLPFVGPFVRGFAFQIAHRRNPLPTLLTTAHGDVLARNRASRRLVAGKADLATLLAPVSTDPDPVIYRLLRRSLVAHVGRERVSKQGREHLVEVVRTAGTDLVWRIVELTNKDQESGPLDAIPHLHIGRDGLIAHMNAAARAIAGDTARTVEDIVADPPLRPDGIHVLAGREDRSMRVSVLPDGSGGLEVLLLPCDPSEVSGTTPERVLDDMPVPLARLEEDGTVIYANTAARKLLGERAVPGVLLSSLVEGLARPIPDRLADTAKGIAQGRAEVARGRVNDHEVYMQLTLSRVMMNGEPSILAVFADATELKTLEAQFVQSQKMQAVGQLAGGVAHDFNNLLTAIAGHCDLLLLRHASGDADHADLMQVRQNANRAAALVRQLLAFSRKQTLRPTVLNLYDSLAELAHLLNRLLGERVTLNIDSAEDLWHVRVDERQFEQVIMNLVVNARDAMPDGGDVRVSTRNERLETEFTRDRATVLPGLYVVVQVADSGIGIPADKLAKIFEPFYTTKRVGEGTGLGLSTAYGIVKQTGGFIFCDSTPGEGTTFSIYLPALDPEEAAAEARAHAARPAPPKDLSGRGVILLVEDEAPVRSFAARALQLRGYSVLEAESGEEALEILEDDTAHIDLFISDVIMPGLDGPSWVREARKTRPETPTIFVSGYAEDHFKNGDRDGDLDDTIFLPKPFTLSDLSQKVKELLSPEG